MVPAGRKRRTDQCQHKSYDQSEFHSSISLPPSILSISPNNLHEPVLAGSRVRRHVASGELGECAGADTKTRPTASNSISLLCPGISVFPGSRYETSEEMRKFSRGDAV